MVTVKQVAVELVESPITNAQCWAEFLELVEALRKWDATNALEEWNDVWVHVLIALYQRAPLFGFLPVLRGFGYASYQKFARRKEVWIRIFAHHGLPFRSAYTRNGGNFMKDVKVVLALQAAGHHGTVDFAAVRREQAEARRRGII